MGNETIFKFGTFFVRKKFCSVIKSISEGPFKILNSVLNNNSSVHKARQNTFKDHLSKLTYYLRHAVELITLSHSPIEIRNFNTKHYTIIIVCESECARPKNASTHPLSVSLARRQTLSSYLYLQCQVWSINIVVLYL